MPLRQTLRGILSAPDANDASVDGQFFFQRDQHGHEPREFLTRSSMSCVLQSTAGQLSGFLQFETRIWQPDIVTNLVSSYRQLLSVILDNADVPIKQLEIVTSAEQAIFAEWNNTARYYPHARVDELFDLRVLERPEDTAVTFLDRSLSYRSLSEKSKQMAIRLQAVGVQPGTVVGVCIDRCLDTVVALLAIFRTGQPICRSIPHSPRADSNLCNRMRARWWC